MPNPRHWISQQDGAYLARTRSLQDICLAGAGLPEVRLFRRRVLGSLRRRKILFNAGLKSAGFQQEVRWGWVGSFATVRERLSQALRLLRHLSRQVADIACRVIE